MSEAMSCPRCGGGEFYLLPTRRIMCANDDCGALYTRSGFEVSWETRAIVAEGAKE